MARKSRQVESRMISEYLKQQYSEFTYILNQPVGKVDEDLMREVGYKKALGLSRAFRPIVDAVVILPRYFLLVEAKVWNVVNGLAKLPLYKSLIPFTPELKQYGERPVLMQLVVAWTNPNLVIMCTDLGVDLKLYSPPWLQEITDSMHKYWTREYREERDAKIRMRQVLGLD